MRSYVCVLSTDNYLDGVLVLNENLKRIKSNYTLICIINENISKKTRDILKCFGIEYKEIKNIQYSFKYIKNEIFPSLYTPPQLLEGSQN